MTNLVPVLTIGPSPELLGGMSTVIAQMIRLDFGSRFEISALPVTVRTKPDESGAGRIARHLKQRLLLGKTLRETSAAIIHIHTCSGFSFHRSAWDMRVARRHGCRTILHMHGARFDEYFARANRIERALVRRTLESADCVVVLSQGWKAKLQEMSSCAKVCVIENAVEVLSKTKRSTHSARCRFLMLGRMDTWKGLDDLLDACAVLKRQRVPFGLTLAGPEGSAGDAGQIRSQITERGLRDVVAYIGPVEGNSKEHVLAQSDVLVQPSHQEGMPMSILEAFARGLPVIATGVGAVPEIIEHAEQGLLVPAKNPTALAGAMGALAVDPPTRACMGRSAQRLAFTRFSITRFRDDLIELYDSLLREKPSRSASRNVIAARAAS